MMPRYRLTATYFGKAYVEVDAESLTTARARAHATPRTHWQWPTMELDIEQIDLFKEELTIVAPDPEATPTPGPPMRGGGYD